MGVAGLFGTMLHLSPLLLPFAPLSSVEKTIRRLTLNYKNALLPVHNKGAVAWGHNASLFDTATRNGVEPWASTPATP